MLARSLMILSCAFNIGLIFAIWHLINGFDPRLPVWWKYLLDNLLINRSLPPSYMYTLYGVFLLQLVCAGLILWLYNRPRSRTKRGGRGSEELHGSAKWAEAREIDKMGAFKNQGGMIIGGFRKGREVLPVYHNGSQHVLCFAPTGSGKGISVVLPSLLNWKQSLICLDIKGENFALTSGYRQSIGQNIFRFSPTETENISCYNPLAEVAGGTEEVVKDCQNIALMIIDPDGKGLNTFWKESGFDWLTTCIMHVLYRVRNDEGRCANLIDVAKFLSATFGTDPKIDHEQGANLNEEMVNNVQDKVNDASLVAVIKEMLVYDHKDDMVNEVVRIGANIMDIKAPPERSGVHSSAYIPMSLYKDPVVARSIAKSSFKLSDLMHGEAPASLYLVAPPSDIDRLRPLFRIIINQFMRNFTQGMEYENGRQKKHYRHELLLMLDEFTSLGKLEIFETSLAYIRSYGLRSFIIIQDVKQLHKHYGKDNSIFGNSHVRCAFAPNDNETAKLISDMCGTQTIQQVKVSKSDQSGNIYASHSESINEVSRPLLTTDECLNLKAAEEKNRVVTKEGDMLIFMGGRNPILGAQYLFFKHPELVKRTQVPPAKPDKTNPGLKINQKKISAPPFESSYANYLEKSA